MVVFNQPPLCGLSCKLSPATQGLSLIMCLDPRLRPDAAQLHNLCTDKSERDVRKSVWR